MDFKQEFQHKIELVNQKIEQVLTFPDLSQSTVFEAMRYSAFAGGKRIRPVLTLACCQCLGGREADALTFGAAIELIHTYSLIHDDLPAMDNDDLRRGKPTNHKVYGEAMAILAGDGLLNYAYELCVHADCSDRVKVEMLKLISQSAGVFGMVGGQVVDMESEGKAIEPQLLHYLHSLKTGALLTAACGAGAIAAGCDKDTFLAYSQKLGLAFQIKDDILDYTSSAEVLGKPVGSDEKNQKSTFITLYGLAEAERYLEEATQAAIRALAPFGEQAAFLRELALYLLNREK